MHQFGITDLAVLVLIIYHYQIKKRGGFPTVFRDISDGPIPRVDLFKIKKAAKL